MCRQTNDPIQGIKTKVMYKCDVNLHVCRQTNDPIQGIKTGIHWSSLQPCARCRQTNDPIQGIKTICFPVVDFSPVGRQTNDPIQGIKTWRRKSTDLLLLVIEVDRPMTRFRGLKRSPTQIGMLRLSSVDRPMTRFRGLKRFGDKCVSWVGVLCRQTNDPIQGIKTFRPCCLLCFDFFVDRPMTRFRGLKLRDIMSQYHLLDVDRPMTRFRGLKLLSLFFSCLLLDFSVDRPMTRFRGLKRHFPPRLDFESTVDRPMTRFRGLKRWYWLRESSRSHCRQTNDPIQGIKTVLSMEPRCMGHC